MMEQFVFRFADQLSRVGGISAVVLGGSRARLNHTQSSDIDLGLYYRPDRPIDLVALERLAKEVDAQHRDGLVTKIGEWGPWINGGGWLKPVVKPVDLLYRDLTRVAQVIAASQRGQITIDYQPGHPHGFASYIYMGEIAICEPIWDPQGIIAALKAQTRPYPRPLQKAIIDKFLWEARFATENASKGATKGDAVYVAGCLFRAVMCLLQTLFALNEEYWLNEKGALALADGFGIKPALFRERIETAFGMLGANSNELNGAIRRLIAVTTEVERLAGFSG